MGLSLSSHERARMFAHTGHLLVIPSVPYRMWFSSMTAKVKGTVVKEISSISGYTLLADE